MSKKFKELVEKYKENKPLYDAFTIKIKDLVKTLLEETGINVHSVTCRTKDINSFEKKICKLDKYYQKFDEITDLSGVRIICFYTDQVDSVAEIIKKNFIIVPEFSVDKREMMDPDRFGYLSLHYVVKLSKERARLSEYVKYSNLYCEIQIRTLLQHTWAEIEHDLGYKSEIEIPRKFKRRFYRLAGMLELADDEFNDVLLNIEDYSEKIEKKMKTSPKKVLIDKVTLTYYLETSDIVQKILKKIADYTGDELLKKCISVKEDLNILKYLKITNIYDLNKIIKENSDMIFEFAKNILTPEEDEEAFVEPTIVLFYLAHYLVTLTEDDKIINEYVKIREIPRPQYYVKTLKKVYQKISKNKEKNTKKQVKL